MVADTLVELDRGDRTKYRSFCNWKQTIYLWRHQFKKTYGLANVNPKSQEAKGTITLLPTAANNSNFESYTGNLVIIGSMSQYRVGPIVSSTCSENSKN